MQELQRINGIGWVFWLVGPHSLTCLRSPIKSRALVESGCMSLQQLHEERFFNTLPKAIQASLKYEQDIEARVTRRQAEAFMVSISSFQTILLSNSLARHLCMNLSLQNLNPTSWAAS
jgi:hypothetical protein